MGGHSAGSGNRAPPLIYAGIVALLAILPMAVLEGRPGAFFSPMVVAYATAVVAALIVGMTVGPALNSLVFARWQPKLAHHPGLWRGSVHATAAVCKGSPGAFVQPCWLPPPAA